MLVKLNSVILMIENVLAFTMSYTLDLTLALANPLRLETALVSSNLWVGFREATRAKAT